VQYWLKIFKCKAGTYLTKFMENGKSYLVINNIVNPENKEKLPLYMQQTLAIFKKHGGNPSAMYKTSEQILGEGGPHSIAVIEFPDAEAIKSAFASEEFKAMAEMRESTFKRLDAMIVTAVK
jgi:uncharacterized protein (DUF1330 family)